MWSLLVLALCLLISGGISEADTVEASSTDEEREETTSTTPLSGPVFNYSETNPELEKYQDAWKFVTSNESFIMKYRNFNTNPTGQNTTSCVNATMIYKNETTHYVLHHVTYLNTTNNMTIGFNKSYYVISSDCYTTRNVLNGTVAGTNTSELYPFAFADRDCAVIRKDSWSNEQFMDGIELAVSQSFLTNNAFWGLPKSTRAQALKQEDRRGLSLTSSKTFKACELWVFESALEKELSCCDFVFDLLCTRGYKQETYDPKLCKPKDTEVNVGATEPTTITNSNKE